MQTFWSKCLAGAGALLAFLLPDSSHAGWKLSFSEEFDAGFVDRTKWRPSDYWGNQTLAGNAEKQCYTPDAFEVQNGILVISAVRRDVPASQCKGAKADLPYSSGLLSTAGCNKWEKRPECSELKGFSQAYGYFEIRAKLPKGKGLWPAFWLLPADGSWPPEIDVIENLGHEPSKTYHTYHFTAPGGEKSKAGESYSANDFSSDFNTFGVDWRPGLLVWYVNGKEVYRYANPDIASKAMYLLVNLAVGGHWPGNPDESTSFPAKMEVDYIRAYQRVDDGQPDDLPPSSDPLKTGSTPQMTR